MVGRGGSWRSGMRNDGGQAWTKVVSSPRVEEIEGR